MMPQTTYFFAALCLAAWVSAAGSVLSWQRRNSPGGLFLSLLLLAIFIWTGANAFELLSVSVAAKVLWSKIEYFGIVSSPVFFFLFAIEFSHNSHWLTNRRLALLGLPAMVNLAVAWTNDWHHWLWTDFIPGPAGSNLIIYVHGPWYPLLVGYSYLLIFLGIVALFSATLRFSHVYRSQALFILLGSLPPILGNLAYVYDFGPISGLDLTPISFALTGALLVWGMQRNQLLNFNPVAREALVETMSDGVIVLDRQDRIIDINPAARKLFIPGKPIAIGQPMSTALEQLPEVTAKMLEVLLEQPSLPQRVQSEIVYAEPAPSDADRPALSYLDCKITPLFNRRGQANGRLIDLRDITGYKRIQTALQEQEAAERSFSERLEELHEISLQLSLAETVDELCRRAIELGRSQLGFDRISIWFVDSNDPIYLSGTYGTDEKGRVRAEFDQHHALAPDSMWGQLLKSKRTWVHARDVDLLDHQGQIVGHGERLVVAMWNGREIIGRLALDNLLTQQPIVERQRDLSVLYAQLLGHLSTLKKTEQELRNRTKLLSVIMDGVPALMAYVDAEERYIYANRAYCDWCGLELADLIGRRVKDLSHPAVYQRSAPFFRAVLAGEKVSFADRAYTKAGDLRDVVVDFIPEYGDQGEVKAFFALIQDVTALKQIEAAEREQRVLAEALADTAAALNGTLHLPEVLDRILANVGRVVSHDEANFMATEGEKASVWHSRGTRQTQLSEYPWAELPGLKKMAQSGQALVIADTRTDPDWKQLPGNDWIRSYLGVPVVIKGQTVGFINLHSAAAGFYTQKHANWLQAFTNQAAIAIENARLYAEVKQLAIVDELTGLYNYRGLLELGGREVERSRRFQRPLSALFFDIDKFKDFNDQYSHAVGNRVLQAVAGCARSQMRAVDLVTRYGGEEFVILLPETNLYEARLVGERLRLAIAETRLSSEHGCLGVTVSVGVAQLDDQMPNLLALIDLADRAEHAAKAAGRNKLVSADQLA